MDGFKTNYNISDVIKMLRCESEPWTKEFDEVTSADVTESVKKRWERNKEALNVLTIDFKDKPSTVGDM